MIMMPNTLTIKLPWRSANWTLRLQKPCGPTKSSAIAVQPYALHFFIQIKGEIFLNELNTMPGFTQWSTLLGTIWTQLYRFDHCRALKEVSKNEAHLVVRKRESGDRKFQCPPAQLSRGQKADEISVVREPTWATASCSTILKQSRG